jgi:hypothetical protein
MKRYEPSENFESRMMEQISAYEASKIPKRSWSQNLVLKPVGRYAFGLVGGAFGLFNLLRIYFSVFFPVVCN